MVASVCRIGDVKEGEKRMKVSLLTLLHMLWLRNTIGLYGLLFAAFSGLFVDTVFKD